MKLTNREKCHGTIGFKIYRKLKGYKRGIKQIMRARSYVTYVSYKLVSICVSRGFDTRKEVVQFPTNDFEILLEFIIEIEWPIKLIKCEA